MLNQVELTILMPCLNEAMTIQRCVSKAQEFLRANQISGEVLIADNGSSDGSQELAKALGARVIDVPVKGYGAALAAGNAQALGRYIIMGDADDSYDFSALELFVAKLREGYDLVIGNRFAGGIRKGAMPFKNRYLGNPVLSAIGRIFFKCPARDFHCGLRGYSRDSVQALDLRTTGMEYASEMVIKATLAKQRICEVPTVLWPDGRNRAPHLRPWRDGWRHLRFMLLFSPRWLFLYPGLLLMLIGLVLGGILVRGPVVINNVTFDIHSLLLCSVIFQIGYLAFAMAVVAKTFAIQSGLLPDDSRINRFSQIFSLERGLIISIILGVLGLAGWGLVAGAWEQSGFGQLSVEQTMRLLIPAASLVVLAGQLAVVSFLLSVLRLKTKE